MIFVVFLLLIWSAALFHRAEHRQLPQELRRLDSTQGWVTGARIAGHDWRLMAEKDDGFVLKRAFHPEGISGVLRYALPILFLAVMMIVLQNIPLTLGYLAFLYLRWFAVEIIFYPAPDSRFHVVLWDRTIYKDVL